MIFSIQGWVFDVDVSATMEYSAELYTDHCECGYCRNYYTTVQSAYPSLNPFLLSLGINIEGPVDFLPVEPDLCIVSYAVCGRIVTRGHKLISLDDVSLSVQDSAELDYSLSCAEPYFVFTTEPLELPWVLEENMDEVISPANEPECLERMWRKLLNNAEFDTYQS